MKTQKKEAYNQNGLTSEQLLCIFISAGMSDL